jgi:1,4-dihydroxy-2-naphthoate octaprenyltransferase
MIVATCILIGLAAGMTRSVLSIASVAVLIGLTFAAATLTSMSPTSFLALGMAVAGYNLGLIAFVAAGAIQAMRSTPAR